MLKQFARLERTRKWFIFGFVGLMAVSLVIFYAPSQGNSGIPNSVRTEVVAKVGWDSITLGDVAQRKEQMEKQYSQFGGGRMNLAQMGFTDQRFLDMLIQRRITVQEAARLGLSASDAEVAEMLRKQFRDPITGKVDMERYRDTVQANFGDIQKFEQGIRDDLAAQKLQAMITAGVSVSEQEVRDDYNRKNTSFEVSYVLVSADKAAAKITPTDQELQAYFEQHKPEYYLKDPQKQIRYLFVETAKIGEKLNIPDADLQAEYNKLTPEQKQAGVNVQQIVLKVADPKLDESVRAKASEIVQQARGTTGTATEQAFADLAKGKSEDPVTSKNGGRLASIVRKNPNNPSDPLQQTLDMTVGAITEPIKHGNAYYIFRRGDSVPKTFEAAKPELLVSMRNRRGYASAAAVAKKAYDLLKTNNDVAKASQALAVEANMPAATMVKETGYIKPNDDVKDIGVSQQFESGIAPLNNIGDVGEVTPIKNGFAVPVLIGKKDPRDATFDEVKEQVTKAVKTEKAKAQIEQSAKDIIAQAKTVAELKAAAESRGFEVLTAKDYKVGSPLGAEGARAESTSSTPALEEAIYGLKEGEVAKAPVKSGDNWIVAGATKRTEADPAEFDKQKQQLTESLLTERQNQVFDDYIQSVQDRMTKDGSIKIYKTELAKLAEISVVEDPSAMPGRPRMPIPPPQ